MLSILRSWSILCTQSEIHQYVNLNKINDYMLYII